MTVSLPIAVAFSVFVTSFLLTACVRRAAIHFNILDCPNERSSHHRITPRAGGLGFVIAFLIGLAILYYLNGVTWSLMLVLLLGGGWIALVGLIDDFGHVSAKWRFLSHCLVALLAMVFVGDIRSFDFGPVHWAWGYFGFVMTLLLIVWFINLTNFMDGIDGIVGIELSTVSIGASALCFHQAPDIAMLYLLLGAASLGFLLWNWAPAKIFSGDVGSGFLGFVFIVLSLAAIQNGLSIWPFLILYAVFIIDATITLVSRLARGERWYTAHCSHAYQRLAKLWGSHARVSALVGAINIFWLLPWAFIASCHRMTCC